MKNRDLELVLKEQIIESLEYAFEIDNFLDSEGFDDIQDLYNISLEELQVLENHYTEFINSY